MKLFKNIKMKIYFLKFLFIVASIFLSQKSFAQTSNCTQPNSINRVYKTKNSQFEFVIFKIKNNFTGNYIVTSLSPPLSLPIDEGGQSVSSINGCAYKKITFKDMNWMCNITPNNSLSTWRIKDIKRVGNFEGVVTFIVGYRCPSSKYITTYSYNSGAYKYVVMKFRKY